VPDLFRGGGVTAIAVLESLAALMFLAQPARITVPRPDPMTHLAAGFAAMVLLGFLSWAAWWLISDQLHQHRQLRAARAAAQRYRNQRDEMAKHQLPAHAAVHDDQTLTVAELLTRAAREGQPLRLNWSDGDTDPHCLTVAEGLSSFRCN
jgi:hypothetical protein